MQDIYHQQYDEVIEAIRLFGHVLQSSGFFTLKRKPETSEQAKAQNYGPKTLPLGSMYPNSTYFGPKGTYHRNYFKAKVYTIWVHGP